MRLGDADLMTAVPESICVYNFDSTKLRFAGPRHRSVTSFSFDSRKSRDGLEPNSPSSF